MPCRAYDTTTHVVPWIMYCHGHARFYRNPLTGGERQGHCPARGAAVVTGGGARGTWTIVPEKGLPFCRMRDDCR